MECVRQLWHRGPKKNRSAARSLIYIRDTYKASRAKSLPELAIVLATGKDLISLKNCVSSFQETTRSKKSHDINKGFNNEKRRLTQDDKVATSSHQ